MRLKYFIFIGLFLSQLFSLGYGQYRGTFFGRANFDFSTPFVFLSKYESLTEDNTIFGDYFYQQFSVPFHLSLELAHLSTFTKQHRFIGLWKIKYSDDPINFIFTESTKSKINATKFNSQNLNNFILFKYVYNINPFYEISPSFHMSFDLNRDSRLEEFTENYYNAQIYSLFLDFKMRNLGDTDSELKRMLFNFSLGYSYNYLPNSLVDRSLAGLPNIKEDFQSLVFNFKYLYNFHPYFFLNIIYGLNFKAYVEKPVISGSQESEVSGNNEKDLVQNLDVSLSMGFLDRGSYRIIGLTTAFSFGYYYSTYVELLQINRETVGRYSLPGDAWFINSVYLFYQEGFKNYLSGLAGLYLKLNINENNGFQLGYTFGLKYYMNDYGKMGSELYTDPTPGNVSTSGGGGDIAVIDSYGTYTDEKRRDLFHTVSFGYVWKSQRKDRSIYPYFGMQKGGSNDQTKNLNRYIFLLGLKISYEF